MAPLRTVFALLLSLGVASAFAPAKNVVARQSSLAASEIDKYTPPFIFDDAVDEWNKDFPALAKWGWGPSVQAEKWNGRHAMFGWVFICASAYCKGHGLIPDAATLLDVKEWGPLARIMGTETISNERAIILAANMHFFAISLLAAFNPLPFGDNLLDYEENPSNKGFGYLPAFKLGLTPEAEILNGRLAMVGLTALVFATAVEQKPMLDIVNEWVGGRYY